MAQSIRMNEMEEYIKKMGELLNVVYRKASDAESKVYALEAGLSKLSAEVEALKADKTRSGEDFVSKEEYEEFMNRLTNSLREITREASGTIVSQQ
jgi:hypothetical protein